MIALILCDGEPPSSGLLLHHLQQTGLIVCTDGAVGWVCATGCCPDIVIGDMDSAGMLPECEIINSGPHGEQENSDAEKASCWRWSVAQSELWCSGPLDGGLTTHSAICGSSRATTGRLTCY